MKETNSTKSSITNDILNQQILLIEKGITCMRVNFLEAAYDHFTKVLSLNPNNQDCLSYRAQCNSLKGKYKESFQDAMSLISINPKNINAYYQASLASIEMYDFTKANELLLQAESLTAIEPIVTPDLKSLRELYNKRYSLMTIKLKSDPSYEKYITFIKELYENNCSINKVNIGMGKDSRGVFAIEDIKDKEIILQLPKDMLISLEIARNSSIGLQITKEMKLQFHSPNHTILTVYLLDEIYKGDSSYWKFYIDMLPKDYSHFPIFYSQSEMNLIQGTQFYYELCNRKREIYNDYNLLSKSIKDFSNKHSLREFIEIRMIICSRIFGIMINGIKTDVLAPYADLLNHQRHKQTIWNYHDKTNSFEVIALENIPKGSEVFDSYGNKSNHRFLLNYGFIIEDNMDDIYKMPIIIDDKMCRKLNEKKHLLNGINHCQFNLKRSDGDSETIALLSLLRFMNYEGNVEELDKGMFDIKDIPPISCKNEKDAMIQLKIICDAYMENYHTTIQEDMQLLQFDEEITYNKRNCIFTRLGEKQILKYYSDLAMASLELLNMNPEVFSNIMKNLSHNDCYYKYKEELYETLFVIKY